MSSGPLKMNRSQRVVVILYCIVLLYCSVWVPWHVQWHYPADFSRPMNERVGYGWLWAGPQSGGLHGFDAINATPDFGVIALRVVAVTVAAAASFMLAGLTRKKLAAR
jgi:hypothetical protein